MKFGRKKLWLSPLKQVDKNDKEEKGGDGDEDHIDDDGSGQGEEAEEWAGSQAGNHPQIRAATGGVAAAAGRYSVQMFTTVILFSLLKGLHRLVGRHLNFQTP